MDSEDTKNKTEGKKNKYCSDIIDCIDKYLSIFVKLLPFLGLLATLPLYHYAHEENINIFSHYSSWVSFLPAIASLELLMGLWLLLIVFVPGIQVYLFNQLDGNKNKVLLTKEVLVSLLYLLMLVFILAGVLLPVSYSKNSFTIILLLFILIYSAAFFFYSHHSDNSVLFFLSFLAGLTIAYISFFSGILIAYLVSKDNSGWGLYVLLMQVFLGIVLIVVNVYKKDHDNIGMFKFAIILLAFLSLFITPFSATIAREALSRLEVGGEVKRTYYLKESNKSKIPGEFINDKCCVDEFCFTNELSIIWGVGDLIYVHVSNDESQRSEQLGEDQDTKQNCEISELKQHIAIPRNILVPYELESSRCRLPEVCKTREELKEAEIRAKKEQR